MMSGLLPVAVLIPTWNGWEDTKACLGSLEACDPAPSRIVVVDNASTDGTPDRILDEAPGVELLMNAENMGFSKAVNRGLRHLLQDPALKGVLLLNNDVVADPDAPARLYAALAEEPLLGGVCPLIPYVTDPGRVWYGGGRVALWRGYVGHTYLRRPVGEVPAQRLLTGYVTGAAVLLRAACLEEVGLFAEAFPFYAEDADWSLRARRAGWQLAVEPSARIAHRVSASIGGPFSRNKLRARLKALLLLFRRNAAWWQWLTVLPAGLLVTLPQTLLGLLRGTGGGGRVR